MINLIWGVWKRQITWLEQILKGPKEMLAAHDKQESNQDQSYAFLHFFFSLHRD
jgi:hypothetical protein